MRRPAWEPGPKGASLLRLRRAAFEDVGPVLRLIQGAIERGCRDHYQPAQRRAVLLGYVHSLFLEVLGPFVLMIGEAEGQPAGVAQLDRQRGHLRALFVAADHQGRGYGQQLLAWAEREARRSGRPRLHGAMSLNAVPFYQNAGFRPIPDGRRWITHANIIIPILPMEKPLT